LILLRRVVVIIQLAKIHPSFQSLLLDKFKLMGYIQPYG
jgi:hypothetical protein